MLSPTAKDFVPLKNLVAEDQSHFKSSLSPHVEEFVPSGKSVHTGTSNIHQSPRALNKDHNDETAKAKKETSLVLDYARAAKTSNIKDQDEKPRVWNKIESSSTRITEQAQGTKDMERTSRPLANQSWKQQYRSKQPRFQTRNSNKYHEYREMERNWREKRKELPSASDHKQTQETFPGDEITARKERSSTQRDSAGTTWFGVREFGNVQQGVGLKQGFVASRGRGRGARRAWDDNSLGVASGIRSSEGEMNMDQSEDAEARPASHGQGRGRGMGHKDPAHKSYSMPRNDRTSVDHEKTSAVANHIRGSMKETSIGDFNNEWTLVGSKKKGIDSKKDLEQTVSTETSTKSNYCGPPHNESNKGVWTKKEKGNFNSPHMKRKAIPDVNRGAWVKGTDTEQKKAYNKNKLHPEHSKERFVSLDSHKKDQQNTQTCMTDNAKFLSSAKRHNIRANCQTKNLKEPNGIKSNALAETQVTRSVAIPLVVNFNAPDAKTILKKDETAEPKMPEMRVFEKEDFPDLGSNIPKPEEHKASLTSDWLSGGTRMPILSYSAILKTAPQTKQKLEPSKRPLSASEHNSRLEGNGDTQGKKKKKKKKKKKAESGSAASPAHKIPPTQQTSPKKTKEPLQFDIGQLLASVKFNNASPKESYDKQGSKKKMVIQAGGLPAQLLPSSSPISPSKSAVVSKKPVNMKGLPNMLDSTAPVIKRGKEREVPKKKKPTAMKRIILKEREEKKKEREASPEETESGKEVDVPKSDDEKEDESDKEEKEDEEDMNGSPVEQDEGTSDFEPSDPSEDDIKAEIHSRRFREYCDQVLDNELNTITTKLLSELVRFQDRVYFRDPEKAKAKRRFVVGLREVTKHLKLKKIKCVILSPNVERIKSAGGLDDTLHNIISIAHANGVPVVFAMRRQLLGRAVCKKVPVSAVGIFNYDGAQDLFKTLMELTEQGRRVYAERWNVAQEALRERLQKERETAVVSVTEEASAKQQGSQQNESGSSGDESTGEEELNDEDNVNIVITGASDETTEREEETKNQTEFTKLDCTVEDLELEEGS